MSTGIVEILGPWLLNKGDDLMLRAVVERLGSRHRVAASSDLGANGEGEGPDLLRVRWPATGEDYAAGVRAASVTRILRFLRKDAALRLLPTSALARRGYVSGRAVTGLLDCSGFAYGDQWSTRRPGKRLEYLTRLKAQGCRMVLLPQALGPFEEPEVRDSARALLEQFDLVFARDRYSFEHVRGLSLNGPDVAAVPDITHLARPVRPADPELWASRVCVVPNTRMLDKTSPAVADRYVEFLVRAIRAFRKGGLEPWMVLHERNDRPLVAEIAERLGSDLPLVDEDGLVTKGILGASYAVLSSRYHALVGALSQGTPALGTSWSHKYEALFQEYGCTHCLVRPDRSPEELDALIRDFIDPGRRRALSEQLAQVSRGHQAAVSRMWDRVESTLNDVQAPRNFSTPMAAAATA